MIKQTINYEDFDGNEVVEEAYFHLSKAELLEMEVEGQVKMSDRLTAAMKGSENGNAVPVLKVLKDFIKASYGERSEDGKRFRKNKEIRESFETSEAYSELLFALLNDGERLEKFLTGLMPAKVLEEVRKEQEKTGGDKAQIAERMKRLHQKPIEDMTPEEFAEWKARKDQ